MWWGSRMRGITLHLLPEVHSCGLCYILSIISETTSGICKRFVVHLAPFTRDIAKFGSWEWVYCKIGFQASKVVIVSFFVTHYCFGARLLVILCCDRRQWKLCQVKTYSNWLWGEVVVIPCSCYPAKNKRRVPISLNKLLMQFWLHMMQMKPFTKIVKNS